jgi:glycyl-tRNA synthetase
MFVNFANVLQTSRKKPPFGIAQIGKSFRNEITPGNFVFRTREFEQMEMEFFVPPGRGDEWYEYWCEERFQWYLDLGMPEMLLRLREHDADELSPLLVGARRRRVPVPVGLGRARGHRQPRRLRPHPAREHSGQKLDYFDQATNERYVPYVIEPAAGPTRTMAAFLLAAYDEDEVNAKGGETAHGAAPPPAPRAVQGGGAAAVEEGHAHAARPRMLATLRSATWSTTTRPVAIGKRYRRQDEIGTPFCVTVDFDSLETTRSRIVRDRDTCRRTRAPVTRRGVEP